jgi:hypothetical protein
VANTANQIGNIERFKKCLLIYWRYRHHATDDQRNKYIQLLGINEHEEINEYSYTQRRNHSIST